MLRILELIEYVDVCSIPKFPISGDYLKQYGYETGHALGKQLKLLKDKWIKNNFVIDKDAIKRSLENSKEN